MRRKLIQFSERALVLTIPSSFVESNDLKKGDTVEVTDLGPRLLIATTPSNKKNRECADLRGLNASLVWHAILSRYIRGSSEINIVTDEKMSDPRSGKSIKHREAVDRAIDAMIGMKAVRKTKRSTTIKEADSPRKEDPQLVLRRLWLNVMSMADRNPACLTKKDKAGAKRDKSGAKRAIAAEREINRLALYLLRMQNIGETIELSEAISQSRLAHCLEEMGDAIKKSARTAASRKHLKAANDLIRSAYKCWFKPTNKTIEELYSALMKVRETAPQQGSCLGHACEELAESVVGRFLGGCASD